MNRDTVIVEEEIDVMPTLNFLVVDRQHYLLHLSMTVEPFHVKT